MMRWTACVALALMLAGCTGGGDDDKAEDAMEDLCQDEHHELWLGSDHALLPAMPDAGRTPGNGFAAAFLTNDMDEWTSEPFDETRLLVGDMHLRFWTQGNNMPAPIIIGGDPGDGYHFFNQIGTERGFIESYAIEYATLLPNTDTVRYDETYTAPAGGVRIEAGERIRLLLTNLVMDDTGQTGPDILWGGDTPSSLTFTTTCAPALDWQPVDNKQVSVSIPFHHGLLTGAVPDQAGLNHALVPFTLHNTTDRLTITMEQTASPNPVKDDMDIAVLDATGAQVWSIGSPYSDEVGTKWRANLDGDATPMPPGAYTIKVNSYSGHAYTGLITVVQERAVAPSSTPP